MGKKEFVSIPQLAEMLGISRIAVYRKVKNGKIKAVKIGRAFAVPYTEVRRLLGKVKGEPLTREEKEQIEKAVAKTVDEYGEVLKKLGKE